MACALTCVLTSHASAATTATIGQPVRLSDWLIAHHFAVPGEAADTRQSEPYLSGLAWQSVKEADRQAMRQRKLATDIRSLPTATPAAQAARDRMAAMILQQPATGRVTVRSADARWLQTNASEDPLLGIGDRIVIPDRPTTVTVIGNDGTPCTRPYAPDVEALQYVLACKQDASPDVAWIVQPDGRVEKVKVAVWNREQQDTPAPGSWIWAPDRGDLWPIPVSERIADFFATQGISGVNDDGHAVLPAAGQRPPAQQREFLTGQPARSAGFPVTGGDWGGAGILQTPTARMNKAGEASLSLSYVKPYTRLNFTLQPLDFLEIAFRYTDISNQLYGSVALSGTQTYKDKSIDAKLRVLRESAYLPEIAVGVRDLAGTGLFSGEYVVGSKRTGPFDWSLGLGWGYVGSRGNLTNPLSVLSSRFRNRPSGDTASGGQLGVTTYFRGPTSFFGGVQYQTPWQPLVLKLEYDGNDYKHEPFSQSFPTRSPFNFGALYRVSRNVDLTFGYERGNRIMFSLSLHGNLAKASMIKLGDPPKAPVTPPPPVVVADRAAPAPDWKATGQAIQAQVPSWHLLSMHQLGTELIVQFDSVDTFYLQDGIDRIVRVLNRDVPADVRTFRIVPLEHGMPVGDYKVNRSQWLAEKTRPLTPSEQAPAVTSEPLLSKASIDMLPPVLEQPPKRFDISVGPAYQQNLGGPNGFILYQISANALATYRLTPTLWIAGDLNAGLIDNYSKFTYDAPSNLPRVRTYLREYLTTSKVTMPFLQLTKVGKFTDNQYYSVYGGLLESMFAGVGGEWLYRPQGSRLAFGVDANYVRQRGFRQNFSLLDYRTLTGHATAYWNTGWHNTLVKFSVGQYLAKDKGFTIDISRKFHNGVVMGVYATKTNVSAAQFGEGSFDKGIYISIPFDAMMTRSSSDVAKLTWAPLTRDGGAKLNRVYQLYDLTDMSDPQRLWYSPSDTKAAP